MRDAFIAQLMESTKTEPRIMLITGDLGFGVLTKFQAEFPNQFLNAGVAEQNMTGLATGLAMDGRIVFTYSIANFPVLRCLEQIRNDAAYHDANVKVVSIGGGFSYGALGMSHHATEDLAIMRAIPNISVFSPGCRWEVKQATKAIIATQGACYLRLDKSYAPDSGREGEEFVVGKMRVLRDGSDVTLMATGGILAEALLAAADLQVQGISARVISVPTIRPFDRETLFAACSETKALITIEEHVIDGGLGGLVAETCMDAGIFPKKFHRIALRDGFSAIVGSQEYLRTYYSMDRATMVAKARELIGASLVV